MNKRLAAGVAGLFALSVSAASAATTSCSTVAACVFGSNTSSGIGVEGNSKTGVGVTGISTSGYAISGTSASNFGVSGVSTSNHGVNGVSTTSFGIVGTTKQNATSTGAARAGVLGQDSSTNKNKYNSGVAGTSVYGFGGSFTSTYGIGLSASSAKIGSADMGPTVIGGPVDDPNNSTLAVGSPDGMSGIGNDPSNTSITVFGNASAIGGRDYMVRGIGCHTDPDVPVACQEAFSIDSWGDAVFGGTVTQDGTPQFRTTAVGGKYLTTYGDRTSSPTLEDFGKSTLRAGAAYVALEPAFASTTDASAGYMVFITPEGNSHGLYTTQITPRGFTVRENDGGKSSLVFDYRIVAHPADTKNARLAVMPRVAHHAHFRNR